MSKHTSKIGTNVSLKDYVYTRTDVYMQQHVFQNGYNEAVVVDNGNLKFPRLRFGCSYNIFGSLTSVCEVLPSPDYVANPVGAVLGQNFHIMGDKIVENHIPPAGYTPLN